MYYIFLIEAAAEATPGAQAPTRNLQSGAAVNASRKGFPGMPLPEPAGNGSVEFVPLAGQGLSEIIRNV